MKILITGAGGMTGFHLCPIFREEGFVIVPTDITKEDGLGYLDVRDIQQVENWVFKESPDLILHMAAETDVEVCEQNPNHAYQTNTIGTQNVALTCKRFNLPMVYISTIGVFDGEKDTPYIELDNPNPPNVYGLSKYGGEVMVRSLLDKYFIVRASWMMGGGNKKDKKFVGKLVKQILSGQRDIWAVTDKIGSPTYAEDFSKTLAGLIKSERFGTYHCACADSCSRYEVASEIVKSLGCPEVRVHAVLSTDPVIFKDYPTKRPKSECMRSLLLEQLRLSRMRSWRESLKDYIDGYFHEAKEEIAKRVPIALETWRNKRLFVVASHTIFYEGGDIYGPAHGVIEYLEKIRQPYVFLKHPLYADYPSEVLTRYDFDEEPRKEIFGKKIKTPILVQYPKELIFNLLKTWQLKKAGFEVVFIGVDPLNALAGLILKKLKKVGTFIAFTPDYSPKKYSNSILNVIYHFIDRLTTNHADFVWGVSSRIVDIRKKQGISDYKNFQIPNSPSMGIVKSISAGGKNKFDLVIVSSLNKAVNFPIIFKGISFLKKEFPHLRLRIIGSGGYEDELRTLVKDFGIEEKVLFLGKMSHEEVFKNLKECGVGVALYTNELPWTYYCDPMKVRDYLACGLPVIMTDVPSLAREIVENKAGEVIELTEDSFKDAVRKILSDSEKYNEYQKNALKMGETHDLDAILEKSLRPVSLS